MSKPGDKPSAVTADTADAGDGRSEIDRRITRLARKYLDSPDRETAVKLASAVYPLVFAACYDLGGGLAVVSESTKAGVEDLFDNLESLLSARRASRYVTRRAYLVAAGRALQTDDGGRSSDTETPVAAAAALTGPELSAEARRGIALSREAAAASDPSLSPLLREALGFLAPRARVALVLSTVSSTEPDDLDALLFEAHGPEHEGGADATALTAGAAVSIFEYLGRVGADG